MSSCRDPTLRWGVLLASVAGVVRIRPLGAPDTWWHLNIGRIVLETGQRSFPDRMAIEVKDRFVAGEWGFDVLAWSLYRLGGANALVAFAALAAAASALLVWALARDVAGRRRWTALAITAAVVAATSWRFFPRPHVLFLCLLPALLWMARRAGRATDRTQRRRWLLGLLALEGLWAQVHPSVIIAPVLAAGSALPWVLGRAEPREGTRRLHRDLWLALPLLALIPFTSPYGLGLLGQVLGHSGTNSVAHIGEMHPMAWADFWPPDSRSLMAVEALVLAGLLGMVRRRRVPVGPLLLACFGLLMTLNTHRFRAAWAILLVPLVADVVRPRWEGRGVALAALLAAGLSSWSVSKGWDPGGPGPTWQSIDRAWVPEALGDALDALDVRGDVFNDYDAGGYIGFRRLDRVRVFIDGRTPPYFTDDHFWAARRALADPALFDRLDREHRFAAAIVPRDAALCAALDASDGWDPLWFDGARALFGRPGAGPPLEHLNPCSTRSNVLACRATADKTPFERELRRLFALSPTSPYLGRLGYMLDAFCLHPAAPDAARWASGWSLEPDNPELHWTQARDARARGDLTAAAAALEPDETARSARLRVEVQADRGDPSAIREAALRDLALEGDETLPAVHGRLAAACLALGDRACAVHEGLRAALAGDARGRDVLMETGSRGWVPFELRRLARAAVDPTAPPGTSAPSP